MTRDDCRFSGPILRAMGVFAVCLLATACSKSESTSDTIKHDAASLVAPAGQMSSAAVSAAVSVLASPAAAADAESGYGAPGPAGYRLVWSDEFNGDGLPSPAKWDYDTSRNGSGWGSGQLQYYSRDRPQNARVEDGNLIILARKENTASLPNSNGQLYSSARLVTRGRAEWTYGFFDIRAKIPCGEGIWPAIWMLPAGSHRTAEIDIMQSDGFTNARINGALHSPHTQRDRIHQGGDITVGGLCNSFHNYQAEWTPDRITLMVDGDPYYHLSRPGRDDRAYWPFTGAEYLILNISVGGQGTSARDVDPDDMPAQMLVDYVRVYQK